MDPITTVMLLMLCVTIFAALASKIGVPYPTMMVVGGLVISQVPWLQDAKVVVEPDLIFKVFLPPLLYGAAWQTSWKDFWTLRRSIFFLAVGLVLFSTAGVAALVMLFIPGFTWSTAFVLGAILSPPDAIAVTALTKKIRLPRRVVLLLEGESLVNDASALVALRFAVVATLSGTFSITNAAGEFLLTSAGGILLGLFVGWLVAAIHRRMSDPLVETTITFLTPYAAYLIADEINVSAVLAVVTAGLYVSWKAPEIMKPQVRLEAYAVWDFMLFVLNGFVFVVVGLGLQQIKLPPFITTQALIGYGILLIGGMIVLRMLWVVPGSYLAWMVTRHKFERPPALRQSFLIGWTGMRGVVSLAAALALPKYLKETAAPMLPATTMAATTLSATTQAATAVPAPASPPDLPLFPNRDLILFLAFFIILVTLVLQSLTLPMVVKLLGITTTDDAEAEEREARLIAARAAHAFLKDLTESTDAFGDVGGELRREYENRIARLKSGPVPLPISAVGIDTSLMDLQREAISVERQALVELRANQKLSSEIYQRLMTDLDVEELRLPGRR